MNPLSERSSMFSAKLIVVSLWIASMIMALPNIFFYEFVEVFDEVNGGVKPFCTLSAVLHQQSADSAVSGDYPDSVADYSGYEYHDYSMVDPNNTYTYVPTKPGLFQRTSTFETYTTLVFVTQYLLPLIVISVAYVRMGIKLWLTRTPGAAEQKRDAMILSNKKKTIKMLFIVVTIFGICWMPWHLYHMALIQFPEITQYHYINIIFFISHWLAMSNSCYNPFIYAIYSEKFKREFRECAYCNCWQRFKRRPSETRGIEDVTAVNVGSVHARPLEEVCERKQLLVNQKSATNTINTSIRSLTSTKNSSEPSSRLLIPHGRANRTRSAFQVCHVFETEEGSKAVNTRVVGKSLSLAEGEDTNRYSEV